MLEGKIRSLNSRQQHILLILLQSMSPVTLKMISEFLQVSTRTIQRELLGMDEALEAYNLTLDKKTGVGLSIDGPEHGRITLQQDLSASKSAIQILSQEERQFLLGHMLLGLREPAKLYFFSQKLGVTEATISNDVLKMEPWFERHGIQIIRKPGFGVEVTASEYEIRRAIVDLIYEHFSEEQLMNTFSSYKYLLTTHINRDVLAADHLLHILDPVVLSAVEKALQQVGLAKNMTDSMYVTFVIYTSLAVQRLKQGTEISISERVRAELKLVPEYEYARRISLILTVLLKVRISEAETVYMTMHLLGANTEKTTSSLSFVEGYVQPMIRIVGQTVKLDLQDDEQLQQHLTVHLNAAISRMRLGIHIRNPLLSHTKEKYPHIFLAVQKAAAYVENLIQCPVPEEEIGFLTLHFSASIVRQQELRHNHYRVLLVCTGGMASSQLLATRLEKELPYIHIADKVSLLHLEEWLKQDGAIDAIITTVPLQHTEYEVIGVNPFLPPDDVEKVKRSLLLSKQYKRKNLVSTVPIENIVQKINRYGDSLLRLLERIYIFSSHSVRSRTEVIQQAVYYISVSIPRVDQQLLEEELRKREDLGALIFEDKRLVMLHCRSNGIQEPCICVLKLTDAIHWEKNDFVQQAIILVAPRNAPKESIELISEVSAALAGEDFMNTLTGYDKDAIRESIQLVLKKGYTEKTNKVLRESL